MFKIQTTPHSTVIFYILHLLLLVPIHDPTTHAYHELFHELLLVLLLLPIVSCIVDLVH